MSVQLQPYWQSPDGLRLYVGDARDVLADLEPDSADCCVTSPPYWQQRSYLSADHTDKGREVGAEISLDEYLANLVAVFRAVRRVLKPEGTLWLNLGDVYIGGGCVPTGATSSMGEKSYERRQGFVRQQTRSSPGLKVKDLVGMAWRVAFALQADGWYLRSALPWIKRATMPESVKDRPTMATEYLFLLSKSERYYWDAEAVRRPHQAASLAKHEHGMHSHYARAADYGGRKDNAMFNADRVGDYVQLSGRSYRNTDLFFDGLDLLVAEQRAYLAHLEHVREHGGLLLSEEGEPLALQVDPQGYNFAHYATFPEALVKPLVLASTSERGVCGCGKPWVRVVKYVPGESRPPGPGSKAVALEATGVRGAGSALHTGVKVRTATSIVSGWRPSCACDSPTAEPATVLDPFSGSGTTGAVARTLGRRYVGVDISEKYTREIAIPRLEGVTMPLELGEAL